MSTDPLDCEWGAGILEQRRRAYVNEMGAACADRGNAEYNAMLDSIALTARTVRIARAARTGINNIQGELKMRREVDPMRIKPRKLTDVDSTNIHDVKKRAEELFHLIEEIEHDMADYRPGFAEATKRLEECVMWATKAISG